jgi:hypothetical protein
MLEHSLVAEDGGADGHVHERGGDHPVGEDPGHEEVVVGDPAPARHVLAVEQAGEDDQEHEREGEGEDPAAAVAPEGALLVADLPSDEPEVALERICLCSIQRTASSIA